MVLAVTLKNDANSAKFTADNDGGVIRRELTAICDGSRGYVEKRRK